jgi:3-deoxy-D-manno-octulosonic acid kinase
VKPRDHKQDSFLIVYDADRVQHPDVQLFDAGYWQARDGLEGEAIGRGSALFLETPFGSAVLRQYLRGGVPARFNRDRYLFTGWARSRPVAEFRILVRLFEAGLPVPEPLAALTEKRGLFYTGSLLTRRIMDTLPLADLMSSRSGEPLFWRRIGACVRHFHDRGVIHADLNARNILVDSNDRAYLIDFDRARFSDGQTTAYARNLQRLHRSFKKLWPDSVLNDLASCWEALLGGYKNSGGQSDA